MMDALDKYRVRKAADLFESSQRYAVRYIERWWIDHRLNAKMKRNSHQVNWIRTLTMNMWRRIKVERLNKHADVLKQFCRDVAGCSDRTKKLYRYRSRVIKVTIDVFLCCSLHLSCSDISAHIWRFNERAFMFCFCRCTN